MDEKLFLSTVFAQAQMSAPELQTVLEAFTKTEFKKNDIALQEGQVSNQYFFVETGFFRSFATDYEGNDVTTGFYSTGQIMIDWSSFFLRIPGKENFQATTDSVCWMLSFEKFQTLFHSINGFREAGRNRLTGSYFELKKNSIAMITTPAKERYLQLIKSDPHIVQNASLKHIASFLGVTDTSLSRIRKEITGK